MAARCAHTARVSALKNVDYAKFVADIKAKVEPVLDEACAEAGPDEAAELEATYTGLVPLVYKAQNSLLDGLVTGFITDLILIFVAIVVAMRAFTAGVILAVPSVSPIVIFGLMGWLGIVVDIGTVMTPSVRGRLGRRIVHFMLQYRRALAAGRQPQGCRDGGLSPLRPRNVSELGSDRPRLVGVRVESVHANPAFWLHDDRAFDRHAVGQPVAAAGTFGGTARDTFSVEASK